MMMFSQAGLLFGDGGVDSQAAVDQSHTHGGNGPQKWDIRAIERRGSRRDAENVGVIFAVGGKHHAENLRLGGPSFGKQGPERAIN